MKRERKYRAAIDILKKHIYYWEDVDYGGDSDDLKKDVQNLKDAVALLRFADQGMLEWSKTCLP
jgi:hypothetical protein